MSAGTGFGAGGAAAIQYGPVGARRQDRYEVSRPGTVCRTDPLLVGHGHTAAIAPDGRIVMVIDDPGKVVYLTSDGDVVDSFDAGGCDSTVDGDGNVYLGGCGSPDTVRVYDESHRLIGQGSDVQMRAPVFGASGPALRSVGTGRSW